MSLDWIIVDIKSKTYMLIGKKGEFTNTDTAKKIAEFIARGEKKYQLIMEGTEKHDVLLQEEDWSKAGVFICPKCDDYNIAQKKGSVRCNYCKTVLKKDVVKWL